MKKILISFGLLVATMLSAQESYLLVGGSGWNKIALIEKSSADIVWTHDLGPAAREQCGSRCSQRSYTLFVQERSQVD